MLRLGKGRLRDGKPRKKILDRNGSEVILKRVRLRSMQLGRRNFGAEARRLNYWNCHNKTCCCEI